MMADSCEPLAVSCQLKVLNDDGGWQDVILSASEEFAAVVRKAVRRHPESNYKKSSATKQLFYK